jgi:hypothetical protein
MRMQATIISLIILICAVSFPGCVSETDSNGGGFTMPAHELVFVTYFQSPEELPIVARLAESVRTFGGRFSEAPVWAYSPEDVVLDNPEQLERLKALKVELRTSRTPDSARWLFYAGKVYAVAQAEADAEGVSEVLVYLDDDTILLDEPEDLAISGSVKLAYCPIMHNRSGSLYDEPPKPFWGRLLECMEITDDMLFPMVTPADKQKIRAYFHAGLLAVRPKQGILRQWPVYFERLYEDSVLATACRAEFDKNVFLHQTALIGAVLHNVGREEMVELSGRYNYPIFFERQYGGVEVFDAIDSVVTMRDLVAADNMGARWHEELSGPAEKIEWLKAHLNQ